MKRITGLMLVCILLTAALSGCSSVTTTRDDSGQSADFAPESTGVYTVVDDQQAAETASAEAQPEATLPAVEDVRPEDVLVDDILTGGSGNDGATTAAPTQTVAPTPTSSIDISAYTFDLVRDTSFGFTFAYPTQWENVPGKSTICFREIVDDGDFPARVAVSRKKLAHTPSSSKLLDQFQSFAMEIYKQYDPSTFELGALNSAATFMGKGAHEITYLAYSGDIEVKGYMICCNVGRSVYAFHFCASYDDYQALESLMYRIRDSVAVIE